jgi:hypothetical protein
MYQQPLNPFVMILLCADTRGCHWAAMAVHIRFLRNLPKLVKGVPSMILMTQQLPSLFTFHSIVARMTFERTGKGNECTDAYHTINMLGSW